MLQGLCWELAALIEAHIPAGTSTTAAEVIFRLLCGLQDSTAAIVEAAGAPLRNAQQQATSNLIEAVQAAHARMEHTLGGCSMLAHRQVWRQPQQPSGYYCSTPEATATISAKNVDLVEDIIARVGTKRPRQPVGARAVPPLPALLGALQRDPPDLWGPLAATWADEPCSFFKAEATTTATLTHEAIKEATATLLEAPSGSEHARSGPHQAGGHGVVMWTCCRWYHCRGCHLDRGSCSCCSHGNVRSNRR